MPSSVSLRLIQSQHCPQATVETRQYAALPCLMRVAETALARRAIGATAAIFNGILRPPQEDHFGCQPEAPDGVNEIQTGLQYQQVLESEV